MTEEKEPLPDENGIYWCKRCNPPLNCGMNPMGLKWHNLYVHMFDDLKKEIRKL